MSEKIAGLLSTAAATTHPCTLELAATRLPGYSIQRRASTPEGILLSDRFQPIPKSWLKREPVDRRVRGLRFRGRNGEILATVVHGSCHPVNEMCIPSISPDFPGELCTALSENDRHGLVMFLNGAAADINPLTVSQGPAASIRHGRAMAAAFKKCLSHAQSMKGMEASWEHATVSLATRTRRGEAGRRRRKARLKVLAVGSLALVFLPGEIFVETGRAIEQLSPFEATLVVGYSEDSIGYLPPRHVFEEGGYEVGPGRWSYLADSAEPMLRQAAGRLLAKAHRTAHPPGTKPARM